MTRKIFQSIIAVVISVLLLSLALITGVLYNHFETTMLDQLRTTARSLRNRAWNRRAWRISTAFTPRTAA